MNNQIHSRAQDCLMRKSSMKPTAETSTRRKQMWTFASCLIAVLVLGGCASTKVTSTDRMIGANEKLPRPNLIQVYDFAASHADVPPDSAYASQSSAPVTQPTAEQVGLGRQLGYTIASQLVERIREMGLTASQVSQGTPPQLNDLVIRGYLVSIDKGSTAKRMTIGFGSGGSELATAVEVYQMTANGLRKLGSGTVDSEGSKGPGAGVGAASWLVTGSPIGLIASGGMKIYGEASGSATIEGRAKQTAKEIAEQLKIRFQRQGWI